MHPAVARLDQLGIARKRLLVDSRLVQMGDVFAALPGHATDGRKFIDAAIRSGAFAVLAQSGHGNINSALQTTVPIITVENLSRVIGHIADDFYARPSQTLRVTGVTGTNGKTTIASWTAQAYEQLGETSGVIGTLGVGLLNELTPSKNTTPDAAAVHTALRDLQVAGAKHVAMEVSSHALDQGRVSGVRFDTAIFTNLTQDHLDYHGTMTAYGEAKARLFTDYTVRHRVINADDAFGAQLIARKFPQTVTYGIDGGLVRGRIGAHHGGGMTIGIQSPWGDLAVSTPVIGRFNAYNLLAVAATLLAQGVALRTVEAVLAKLTPAPGRMQRVSVNVGADTESLPHVYVDYAHTPDALAKAITSIRETTRGNLVVVFGCGGDRDRSKRAQMGAIAAHYADRLVVTSDNPRSETPQSIINDVISGIEVRLAPRLRTVADRRSAIDQAISSAAANDTILIAGKGHEDYQEVEGVRYPFSDVTEAQTALTRYAAQRELTHAH
jgi:UDP-N-acetylmuramoyl-L-alanyl-D-glutamate--2,6-diaminopimelate ligase